MSFQPNEEKNNIYFRAIYKFFQKLFPLSVI